MKFYYTFNKLCLCRAVSNHSVSQSTKHVNKVVFLENDKVLTKESEVKTSNKTDVTITNSVEKLRFNEFGVQMISDVLYKQLFKNVYISKNRSAVKKCIEDLKKFNLGLKKEPFPNVEFLLPPLLGNSIQDHFFQISEKQCSSYRTLVNKLVSAELPPLPNEWLLQPGWTRYKNGTVQSVPFPPDDAIIFDVEVCRSEGEMPTLATAVSCSAWYGWVSQALATGSKNVNNHDYTTDMLIPLESGGKRIGAISKPRIVVGHYVSYDRARVKEQYWLKKSKLRFLDTLSLHVSISGITSYQKALLKAGVEGQEWSKFTSLNSLSKVYKLYCGSEISKESRNIFISGSLNDVRNEFQNVMFYCANDVSATYSILKHLWPLFLARFPHPTTLAGILELQSAYITVNENWNKYVSDSQLAFEDFTLEAKSLLSQTAKSACHLMHEDRFKNDLWMWDQDWSIKKLKLKKKSNISYKNDPDTPFSSDDMIESIYNDLTLKFKSVIDKKCLLPSKRTLLAGYPQWFVKLCEKPGSPDWIPGASLLTNSMQVTPKLLRLTWRSQPLHYVRGSGWGYTVPFNTDIPMSCDKFPLKELIKLFLTHSTNLCSCLNGCQNETNNKSEDLKDMFCKKELGKGCGLIRLPHKDGEDFNVGNPLGQDFIKKFPNYDLTGALSHAEKIIEISKMLSYWRNSHERIKSQLVCWLTNQDFCSNYEYERRKVGVILPQLVVCGTLTRRAVEPMWMTASNCTADRIGSEFRGIIQSPPGYCFVGADVDSQELWIASLLGDAYALGEHGCTPFGWMTLNGHKADTSDLHSVTAKAVGISRSHAKILNYARIYGAGQKFAQRTLLNFNPDMTKSEASQKSLAMYQLTKGKKMFELKDNVLPHVKERKHSRFHAQELCRLYGKGIEELFKPAKWTNGTESDMFNSLEHISNKPSPETPFLKSKLSRALEPNIDREDKYCTTRVNWVVQSSAVDFLHLMLVCMKWLMGDDIRFSLSFHDEVRYLVPNRNKYDTALALQITNLLTRAFFVSRVGMHDLPLSVAFFSSVEIDTVLRKDSADDNRTPSNPHGLLKGYGIPQGESLDINKCLEKADSSVFSKQV